MDLQLLKKLSQKQNHGWTNLVNHIKSQHGNELIVDNQSRFLTSEEWGELIEGLTYTVGFTEFAPR